MPKLLTLVVAGLDADLTRRFSLHHSGLNFSSMDSIFPALTCPFQASLRTGTPPQQHGMWLNGVVDHALAKVLFWEQSSRLIPGARIWDRFRAKGGRVGMFFWQQSLGESVDWVLSPRPIHKHSGGLIQHVYSEPQGLYEELCQAVGRPFKLQHYWGPLASRAASDWIGEAMVQILRHPQAPELLFSYLPHLDYVLQRQGPEGRDVEKEMQHLDHQLTRIRQAAEAAGYSLLVIGDYSIATASRAVFLNRRLVEAGFFRPMTVQGKAYPDLFNFRAFAVVDHEVARIVIPNPSDREAVRACVQSLPGVENLLECDLHPGGFIATAEEGAWFAYPWWDDDRSAPDFSRHIDIHNKPGFDPCELFWGWPPLSITRDTGKVHGSHGRAGPSRKIAWACTSALPSNPQTPCEVAHAIQQYIEEPKRGQCTHSLY